MKKYTVLEMTQLLLSAMESDEVTSISDTTESQDVANTIRDVYYDSFSELGLPEHETLFQLNASGDNTKPVIMTVPSNVVHVKEIKYDNATLTDTKTDYHTVCFKPILDFIEDQESIRNNDNSAELDLVLNSETFTVYYATDKHPKYFTTIDEDTLIFDSVYSAVDTTTLAKAKTLCVGTVAPDFTVSDSFVPDMDATQFPLLINKAKVRVFNEKKQMINQEAVGEARRQKIISQKTKKRVEGLSPIEQVGTRYGRK